MPPVTIWRTTHGNTEATNPGVLFLMDTLGNFIVDTLGNFIVDTGTAMIRKPATIWVENDAV